MRDLQADLQICNKATPGPWIRSKFGLNILTHDSEISTATQKYSGTSSYAEEQIKKLEANANFIAAAREGWPEAIERAIKAEAEVVRLQAERGKAVEDLQGMCEVLNSCAFCIYDLRGTNENWPTIHCNNKDKRKCWQWRGVEVTP